MKTKPRYTIRQRTTEVFGEFGGYSEPVYMCVDNKYLSIVFRNRTWSEVLAWINR